MRNHLLPLSLLALILALALAFPLAMVLAQDGPVAVRVAPETIQVVAGQAIDIAIDLANARDLYGADVALSFDPAVIQIEDADPSLDGVQVAMGTFLDPGFVLRNLADNATGDIRFAMTQLNPSTPKSGSGTLIVIRVRGRQNGQTSPLRLVRAEVAQPTGVKLPTTMTSGQVQVVNAITGPTATPIPTQGGGTPLPTPGPTDTPGPATATSVPPTATATTSAAIAAQQQPTEQPTAQQPTATPLPPATTVALAATSAPAPVAEEGSAPASASDETPASSAPAASPEQTVAVASDVASAAVAADESLPTTESSVLEATPETVAQATAQTPIAISQAEGLQGQAVRDIQASATSTTDDNTSTFLIAGLALLSLAALIAIVMIVIWRR